MSSYDDDFKYSEQAPFGGTVDPIYSPSFQTTNSDEGVEPMEMDDETYDESMVEPWPASPTEGVLQGSNMFTPFVPQYDTASKGLGYSTYQIPGEGVMFPGVADSMRAGLELDQSLMDEETRLEQLRAAHDRRHLFPVASMAIKTEYPSQPATSQTTQPKTSTRLSLPELELAPISQDLQLTTSQSEPPKPPAASKPASTSAPRSTRSTLPAKSPTSGTVSRRQAHNLVERKYRDTLNSELMRLRQTIPHIRDLDAETPDGRSHASKATVLAAAADYIIYLAEKVVRLTEENAVLRAQLGVGVGARVEDEGKGVRGRSERGGGGRGGSVGRRRRQRGKRGTA